MDKPLYFSLFSAACFMPFLCASIVTSISMRVFSFLFLIIIPGLFLVTSLSMCTSCFHNAVTSSCLQPGLGVLVYHFSVISMPSDLHVE